MKMTITGPQALCPKCISSVGAERSEVAQPCMPSVGGCPEARADEQPTADSRERCPEVNGPAKDALLACPFCGRPPETSSRVSDITETKMLYFVVCFCGGYSARAHIAADSIEAVTKFWNTRAGVPLASPPDAGPAEGQRVLPDNNQAELPEAK